MLKKVKEALNQGQTRIFLPSIYTSTYMFFYLPEKDVVKVFGKNLKKIRLKRKLSMKKLAELSGMELSQIYRIESGKVNTKLSTIAALGKALKVEPSELFKIPNLPE